MIGKLRGRSVGELRERSAQLAHTWADRAGAPWVGRPVSAALAGRAATRLALPVPSDRAWAREIARRWPEHAATVVARAEDVVAGRFALLGLEPVALGATPDWHRDPDAGLRAPAGHWSTVPYLDPAVVGDHKVVWELSRQQYLPTLAQAWQLTGERRFADRAAELLAAWLEGNPRGQGINWASALELAFRSIAWTWTLHLLRDAPAPDAGLRTRVVQALAAHAAHLERYLSTYFSPNTHLTGEALGLLYVGTACAGLPRARRWRETGTRILQAEATRQIRPDGTYFEQTTWYQHYTVEFYLHALLLWESLHLPVPQVVGGRAALAAEVLAAVARPDGTIPLIGDDDGGRTLVLDGRTPGDFRDTLAWAAVRHGRPELAALTPRLPGAAAWVLGPEGVARHDALHAAGTRTPTGVRAFPDGGLYVLGDAPSPAGDRMVVDAGAHGVLTSGHAHADALSFDLVVGGRPALVDPGTGRYVGPARDLFRHASRHNAVTIDGRSAAEPAGWFRWRTVAHAREELWAALPDGAVLAAGIADGWADRPTPATHGRTILWRPGAYFLLLDRVTTGEPAEVALHFRAAAGLAGAFAGADRWRLAADGAPLLDVQVAPAADVAGAFADDPGEVAPLYGRFEPAAGARWSARSPGRLAVATLLAPRRDGRAAPALTAESDGWTVRGEGWTDVVRVGGDGGTPTHLDAPGVRATGALIWARLEGGDGVPTSCFVAAPIALAADGLPEGSHAQASWVELRRRGAGGWTLARG